jgi:uncharacterized membrane protein YesL
MGKLFDFDNGFFSFMTKLTNLVILNILWIIFSLPIITSGAATASVYTVTLKMVKNEEGYIVQSFWKAFKGNLKQGIVIQIILLLCGIILSFDAIYFFRLGTTTSLIAAAVFGLLLLLYTFISIFIFPLLAYFNNTVLGTIKNAFLLSLKHLPTSVCMTVLLLAMMYASYVSVSGMLIVFLLGAALYAYIGSMFFRSIFKKY